MVISYTDIEAEYNEDTREFETYQKVKWKLMNPKPDPMYLS